MSAGFAFAQERSAGDNNTSDNSSYSHHETDTDNSSNSSDDGAHEARSRSAENQYDTGGSTSGGSDSRPVRGKQPEPDSNRPGRN